MHRGGGFGPDAGPGVADAAADLFRRRCGLAHRGREGGGRVRMHEIHGGLAGGGVLLPLADRRPPRRGVERDALLLDHGGGVGFLEAEEVEALLGRRCKRLERIPSGSDRSGRPTICQGIASHLPRLNRTTADIGSRGTTSTCTPRPGLRRSCAIRWTNRWSAGRFAPDLEHKRLAQVTRDGPGCRWATEFARPGRMGETDGLIPDVIRTVAGKTAAGERPLPAGEHSVSNSGLTGLFVPSPATPDDLRTAAGRYPVGGCGADIAAAQDQVGQLSIGKAVVLPT